VLLSFTLIEQGTRGRVAFTVRDITERKEAEKVLQRATVP
jgi:hypothetical protein